MWVEISWQLGGAPSSHSVHVHPLGFMDQGGALGGGPAEASQQGDMGGLAGPGGLLPWSQTNEVGGESGWCHPHQATGGGKC